jgi:hypothetical protein
LTIERMLIVAQQLSLGWTTRASAVAYFDGALCELATIPANAFPLLAMGSLLIAAKMEEEEINVPTVSSLLQVRRVPCLRVPLGPPAASCI